MKGILVIFHSNADCERIFSFVTQKTRQSIVQICQLRRWVVWLLGRPWWVPCQSHATQLNTANNCLREQNLPHMYISMNVLLLQHLLHLHQSKANLQFPVRPVYLYSATVIWWNCTACWTTSCKDSYQNDCHQWLFGSSIMHQIRFRPGLRPGPRCGSLRRSPRFPNWEPQRLRRLDRPRPDYRIPLFHFEMLAALR